MYWNSLDKNDTNLYKGIAILMIATHNFMHLFPAPKENEFEFNPNRFFDLLYLVINESENILRVFLSFFGHFGVQIFIFLSAYGFTKKYLNRQPNYWLFIWKRIFKIYPAFILGILAWAIAAGWVNGNHGILGPIKIIYWDIGDLLLKLSLTSNFISGKSLSIVGPWWFIPFIFQFYFIFPLLRYLYSKWGAPILLAISVAGIVITYLNHGRIGDLNIYFTVLGHLPEFCLGIYLAGKEGEKIKISWTIILAALVLYFLGNIYESFWYVNHISFLILLLVVFNSVIGSVKKRARINKSILFIGGISMPIFLVNGFLRYPFIYWAVNNNHWLLTIALCLLSLTISILVGYILSKIEGYVMPKIDYETPKSLINQVMGVLSFARGNGK
ncbi:MAG: acyltransferase [Pseudomonadales bacterium]|nr:acyltransferase [Pseudomonadales bacterium]